MAVEACRVAAPFRMAPPEWMAAASIWQERIGVDPFGQRMAADIVGEFRDSHPAGRVIKKNPPASASTTGSTAECRSEPPVPQGSPVFLPVELLDPHPDNPRLVLREDVVGPIAQMLEERGRYPAQFSIIVRPHGGGRYQIVAGHHRTEAARRAGIAEIPAWIHDVGDDEALLMLATSNHQSELDPIEVGMHALRTIPEGREEPGNSMSISEYARQVGLSVSRVWECRQAAIVATLVSLASGLRKETLLGRCSALTEVARAGRDWWPDLVQWIIRENVPGVKVREAVARLKDFHVEAQHEQWLPPDEVARRILDDRRFTSRHVTQLQEKVTSLRESILGRPEAVAELDTWLTAHKGGDAWDVPKVLKYARAVREQHAPPTVATIYARSWSTFLETLPPQDLLITDPPFADSVDDIEQFAGEWVPAALGCLGPQGRAYIITGPTPEEQLAYLQTFRGLEGDWKVQQLIWHVTDTLGPKCQGYKVAHRVIWFLARAEAPPLDIDSVTETASVIPVSLNGWKRGGHGHHPWQTPDELAERLVRHAARPGHRVFDPFAGTGSMLLAAARAGCVATGSDVDRKMVAIAVKRGVVAGRSSSGT